MTSPWHIDNDNDWWMVEECGHFRPISAALTQAGAIENFMAHEAGVWEDHQKKGCRVVQVRIREVKKT